MNFDEHSQFESVMSPDQLSPLDEPPPPYPNSNSLLVSSPLSDVFSQSSLLPTERHLTDDRSIAGTASPLAPVPLRHSSLYQVLKQNTPITPAQGTQQSGVSLIAHALGPQGLQARQAPAHTPVLGNTRGPTITSDSALSGGQSSISTSIAPVAAAVDPPTLPRLVVLPPPSNSVQAAATAQSPVSSTTPPSAAAVPARKESIAVVTPSQAHTLAQSLPEVTTEDYDTLPRLRKVSLPTSPRSPCPFLSKKNAVSIRTLTKKLPRRVIQLQPALPGSAREDQSAASSPLSPLSSRPSSSVGAPVTSSTSRDRARTSSTGKSALDSAFGLPLLGRKRPVLRAKLACLFCRRRKIQCRPATGDKQDHTCQWVFFPLSFPFFFVKNLGVADPPLVLYRQCAKRSRQCEYPEMTWRGRGRKRSRSDLEESDDDEEEEDTPSRSKARWNA